MESGKKSLFNHSDKYHTKVEQKQLCDLALSTSEKYNPNQAWVCDLRSKYKDTEFRTNPDERKLSEIDVEEEADIEQGKEIDPIYKNVVSHFTYKNDNRAGPNDVAFVHC